MTRIREKVCYPWDDDRREHLYASEGRCAHDSFAHGHGEVGEKCPSGYKASSPDDAKEGDGKWGCGILGLGREKSWHDKCYKSPESYDKSESTLIDCCTGRKEEKECHPDFCGRSNSMSRACQEKVSEYCSQEKNLMGDSRCDALEGLDPTRYKTTMERSCRGNNLMNNQCIKWCNDNPGQCNRAALNFCRDKIGHDSYEPVCACYYPNEVYVNIARKVAEDYKVKDETISAEPKCIFHACQSARLKRPTQCPTTTIATCYQDLKLDFRNVGSIKNVTVKQNEECRANFMMRGDDTPSAPATIMQPTTNVPHTPDVTNTPDATNTPSNPGVPGSNEGSVNGEDSMNWMLIAAVVTSFVILIISVIIMVI